MSDKSKTGFFAYYEWAEVIKDLPDEQQAKFFRAMFQYAATGEVQEQMNSMEQVAWNLIKGDITRQQEKYARIVEKRREAGRKGGAPVGNQNARKSDVECMEDDNNQKQANQANDCFADQKQANQANKNNINIKSKDKHKDNSNNNNKNYQEDNIISSSSSKDEEEEEDPKNIKIEKGDYFHMFEALKKEIPDDGVKRNLGKLMEELRKNGIELWKDVREIVRSANYGEAYLPIWSTFNAFSREKWRPDNMRAYLKRVAKDR